MAYDLLITGYNTFNTNTLRLWRSQPVFNEDSSDDDNDDASKEGKPCKDQDLDDKIDRMLDAEYLTSMYYPNIPGIRNDANRLKQEYFYSSATLQDLMRRFSKDIKF